MQNNDDDLTDLAREALEVACRYIQSRLGIKTDGGVSDVATLFFKGATGRAATNMIASYIAVELAESHVSCADHWHCDPKDAAHACSKPDRDRACPTCGAPAKPTGPRHSTSDCTPWCNVCRLDRDAASYLVSGRAELAPQTPAPPISIPPELVAALNAVNVDDARGFNWNCVHDLVDVWERIRVDLETQKAVR